MEFQASIVIPLLSQVDAWLKRAVESALDQTVPCEVIVVRSPQTPPSNCHILEQACLRYPQLRVLERLPGMRFAAALNLGIRSATTGRIGFLLSDDWLDPRTVEKCLPRSADLVSTGRTFFAADGTTILRELGRPHLKEHYDALKTQADRCDYLNHFFLFRREALLAVGGVDETLGDSPGVDDFDLIWCLLDQGATVSLVDEPLYNYREHDGVRLTTRNREEMIATFGRILDKHGMVGAERDELMREHSRWFGRSQWEVYLELAGPPLPPPLRPLQQLYRRVIPVKARLAIHDLLRRSGRQ